MLGQAGELGADLLERQADPLREDDERDAALAAELAQQKVMLPQSAVTALVAELIDS